MPGTDSPLLAPIIAGEEMTAGEIKEYWESIPDEAFVETAKAYAKPLAEAFTDQNSTPVTIWSFGFEADEVLAVYAALRTYLRALLNQEGEEDLEMLARIIKIMTQIRPSAVKASKTLSLEAVGMKSAP